METHRIAMTVSNVSGDYLRVLERIVISDVRAVRIYVESGVETCAVLVDLQCERDTLSRLCERLAATPQVHQVRRRTRRVAAEL